MRLDVHTHFLPPSFFEMMDGAGARENVESYSVFGPMLRGGAERLYSNGTAPVIEDWIEQMNQSKIDLSILSLGALQPYFPDRRTAVDATHRANVMLHDAVQQGEGRLGAFGSLPLPHTAAALQELTFCLDECEFVGVNLGTSAGGRPLDAPEYDELWASLDERGATVFIHPGTTPLMGVGAGDFHLAPDFCSPTETALALCRLVVGTVMHRHPHLNVIAAAMGGALPFFAHRFDTGMRRSHPDLYQQIGGVLPAFQRFWYDTSMIDETFVFDAVRHSVGIDRLVFGSDLPRGPLAEAVDFVASSPLLTDAEKTHIFETTEAFTGELTALTSSHLGISP